MAEVAAGVAGRDGIEGAAERLDGLDPLAVGATVEGDGIPWLRFDPAAQEAFDDWRDGLALVSGAK